jgi:hypothetical protein
LSDEGFVSQQPTVTSPPPAASDLQAVERLKTARERILGELRKVIIGQDAVVRSAPSPPSANGHVLLVGVRALPRPCSSQPGAGARHKLTASSSPT